MGWPAGWNFERAHGVSSGPRRANRSFRDLVPRSCSPVAPPNGTGLTRLISELSPDNCGVREGSDISGWFP